MDSNHDLILDHPKHCVCTSLPSFRSLWKSILGVCQIYRADLLEGGVVVDCCAIE